MQKSQWSRGEKIAIVALVVTITSILLSLLHPEVRRMLGLDYSVPTPLLQLTVTSRLPRQTSPTVLPSTSPTSSVILSTAGSSSSPSPYGGILALRDPLHDNSEGYGWDEYSTNTFGEACGFAGGAYHAYQTRMGYLNYCKAYNTNFSNFAFEVQMTIIKGDCGGILFRGDTSNPTNPQFFYQFQVCQDGTYKVVDTYSKKTFTDSRSAAIHQGLNQFNLIAVVAKGNTISIYVNRQQLDSGDGSSYAHGLIGVGAIEYRDPTEVIYSNAEVWTF